MDRYQRFLVEHVETMATVENSLRTLLFFMPGRLRDSQLKLEAAYSALGLVSWFNDLSIIGYINKMRRQKEPEGKGNQSSGTLVPVEQEENMFFPPKEAIPFASWLSFIRFVELLIELIAKTRFGAAAKFKAAFIVESIKCFIKLWLLYRMKGKMLLGNYLQLPQLKDVESVKTYALEQFPNRKEANRRKRLPVSPLKYEKFKEQAAPEGSNQGDVKLVGEAINPKRSSNVLAEVLHNIRPLVYLLSVLKFGEKSWIPLMTSLTVDATSLGCYYNGKTKLSEIQRLEVTRRTFLLSFYFLRNPFYNNITLRLLGGGSEGTEGLSFMGKLLHSIRDYVSIYQEQYFYTSAT